LYPSAFRENEKSEMNDLRGREDGEDKTTASSLFRRMTRKRRWTGGHGDNDDGGGDYGGGDADVFLDGHCGGGGGCMREDDASQDRAKSWTSTAAGPITSRTRRVGEYDDDSSSRWWGSSGPLRNFGDVSHRREDSSGERHRPGTTSDSSSRRGASSRNFGRDVRRRREDSSGECRRPGLSRNFGRYVSSRREDSSGERRRPGTMSDSSSRWGGLSRNFGIDVSRPVARRAEDSRAQCMANEWRKLKSPGAGRLTSEGPGDQGGGLGSKSLCNKTDADLSEYPVNRS
jgi:hypothetical protein